MKTMWMLFGLILLCSPFQASAADMKLDLNIPEVSVEGLQGNSNAVSLWVEDARKETVLGKNLQGENVVLKGDAAAAVMASFSSTLIIICSIRSNCGILFWSRDGPDDASRCPEKYPNHDDRKPPPSLVLLDVFTT